MEKKNATKAGRLLRPMRQKSIVDRIIARLTDAIMNGQLKPGQ
ncbi:MAG: FadR family transcriptional regulator, partial [Clostridiales bacterium]|nr:FadR family transcriptional regulator [Clostridiales bacterium]